jgi:hypothetical protein
MLSDCTVPVHIGTLKPDMLRLAACCVRPRSYDLPYCAEYCYEGTLSLTQWSIT